MKRLFFSIIFISLLSTPDKGYSQCGSDCDTFISTFPTTVNGITIDSSWTGSVTYFINPYVNSCNASVELPGNSIYLGNAGPFEFTFLFSEPVNDIVVLIAAVSEIFQFNTGEEFSFSVDGMPAELFLDCGCLIITNSLVTCDDCVDDGGQIIVSSPNDFTSLTISGDGGSAGSLFGLCTRSLEEYCEIEGNLDNILCDDEGTPLDSSDDTFTFQLELIGANSGASWISNDATISTGNYNTIYTFGPYLISDGNVDIVFTDIDDPNCEFVLIVNAPDVCSNDCTLMFNPNVENIDCFGDFGSISLNVSGANGETNFSWNPSNLEGENPSNLASGIYEVTVEDDLGCTISGMFEVLENDEITIELSSDISSITEGESVSLMANSNVTNPSFTAWNEGQNELCSNCLEFEANPSVSTEYTFTVIDQFGCIISETIFIAVDPLEDLNIYLPNIISPNGDGKNDVFFPMTEAGISNTILEMSIFDRWGNRIFQNENFSFNDISQGWNGKFKNNSLDPGVYVFLIKVLRPNETIQLLTGDLTLLK